MILKFFFERDVSMAHASVAALSILAAYQGLYALAVAVFLGGVAVCVWGELALERRA